MTSFLKVGCDFYNYKYIKSIQCDEKTKECYMNMTNKSYADNYGKGKNKYDGYGNVSFTYHDFHNECSLDIYTKLK